MFDVLADKTYRRLFLAQVVALMGTGLATVALGLLAFDLAQGNAALVLGAILTVKMVAYVTISPIAGALAEQLPRRAFLVTLDLVRAMAAICLPFVTEVWQAIAAIVILQSASAAFTPVFQATIPDILPEEARYTKALSLSRLAYDLEGVASPMLAALLLLFLPHEMLFSGTVLGFVISAMLVLSVRLPDRRASASEPIRQRATKGLRMFRATPRLRGLMGLNVTAAACGAMVLVNSIVLVKSMLGLDDSALGLALGAFGAGSVVVALTLPRIFDSGASDRAVMVRGAALMVTTMGVMALISVSGGLGFGILLVAWFAAGAGFSAIMTPVGRVLRRSAAPEDGPAIFAAQFALSHAAWLVFYPLAGLAITYAGPTTAFALLALAGAAGALLALRAWPEPDPVQLWHRHDDLPEDHPHIQDGKAHIHDYRVDALHPNWPTGAGKPASAP